MYQFGGWRLRSSEVFYVSAHAFAFVNLRPIVDGHVLVAPRRVVVRMAELSGEELEDVWRVASLVGTRLEKHYDTAALTFAVQDGKDAGQTVEHVHVHVLPRRKGDFVPNDKVYDELDSTSMTRVDDLNSHRVDRTDAEMAAEAEKLRALFPESLPI